MLDGALVPDWETYAQEEQSIMNRLRLNSPAPFDADSLDFIESRFRIEPTSDGLECCTAPIEFPLSKHNNKNNGKSEAIDGEFDKLRSRYGNSLDYDMITDYGSQEHRYGFPTLVAAGVYSELISWLIDYDDLKRRIESEYQEMGESVEPEKHSSGNGDQL